MCFYKVAPASKMCLQVILGKLEPWMWFLTHIRQMLLFYTPRNRKQRDHWPEMSNHIQTYNHSKNILGLLHFSVVSLYHKWIGETGLLSPKVDCLNCEQLKTWIWGNEKVSGKCQNWAQNLVVSLPPPQK